MTRIGNSNVYIAALHHVEQQDDDMAIIKCVSSNHLETATMLCIPIQDKKQNKSLEQHLPQVLQFAQDKKKILCMCSTGNDVSIVCAIAILAKQQGTTTSITKAQLRQWLAHVQTFVPRANPSRHLMKQLNRFFI